MQFEKELIYVVKNIQGRQQAPCFMLSAAGRGKGAGLLSANNPCPQLSC